MTVTSVVPSETELQSIELACTKLWELDRNRLVPGVDYEINLQRSTKPYRRGDSAPEPLFTYVRQDLLSEIPTFKLFFQLMDNYERGVGVCEDVTQEERRENWDFLNGIMETWPMQYAYNWLTKTQKFNGNASDFKRKLHELWFSLYRRESRGDSSGFEHVFVGEERDGKVTGLHNWIQIYAEERNGRLDYKGYIKPRQRGRPPCEPHENEQLITIQFAWESELKPISSSFIGVSPEFEMALYTMCFMNGQQDTRVVFNDYECNIKCHSIGRGNR